jgi:hypothetical protein
LGNTTASGDGSSNGAFFRAVLSVRCKKVRVFSYFELQLHSFHNLIILWEILCSLYSMKKLVYMLRELGVVWQLNLRHWYDT